MSQAEANRAVITQLVDAINKGEIAQVAEQFIATTNGAA